MRSAEMIRRHELDGRCGSSDARAIERAAGRAASGRSAGSRRPSRRRRRRPKSLPGWADTSMSGYLLPEAGSVSNGSARRPILSAGTKKPVSTIFSGWNTRSARKSPRRLPDAASTTRPSTSEARLYSHVVPGWWISGIFDRRSHLLGAAHGAAVEVAHAGVGETGLHQRIFHGRVLGELAVGEAGGVAQQVLHRHGAIRRDLAATDGDALVLERGKMLGHRIAELDVAILDQQHGGDGDQRLGHGVDAEDRVRLIGVFLTGSWKPQAPW